MRGDKSHKLWFINDYEELEKVTKKKEKNRRDLSLNWFKKLVRRYHERQYLRIRRYEFKQFKNKHMEEIGFYLFAKFNNQTVICDKCHAVERKKVVIDLNRHGREVVTLVCNRCGAEEKKLRERDYKYDDIDFNQDIKSLVNYGWTRGLAAEPLEKMANEFFKHKFEYEVLRPYIGITNKSKVYLTKDIPTDLIKAYNKKFIDSI